MNRTTPPFASAWAYLCVGVLAVSFSAILIKWSHAPASVIGMYRLVFTVLLLTPLMGSSFRGIKRVSKRTLFLAVCSGVFLGFHFFTWIASLGYTSVASSMILISLQPVFVMIGSLFVFRERPSAQRWSCTFLAVLGAAMVGWGDIGISSRAMFGDVLSIIGTAAVSVYLMIGQTIRNKIGAMLYNYIVFVAAAIVLAVANLIQHHSFTAYPAREWGLFILLALVPTVMGHMLFNWLLKYVTAATISMSILGEPIGAIFLSWWLLGERITWLQLIGGALTLTGVGLYMRSSKTQEGTQQMKQGTTVGEVEPDAKPTTDVPCSLRHTVLDQSSDSL